MFHNQHVQLFTIIIMGFLDQGSSFIGYIKILVSVIMGIYIFRLNLIFLGHQELQAAIFELDMPFFANQWGEQK
jgi:hypothetical protein